MLLTEKESSGLILRIETIIISKGAKSHHLIADLRKVFESLLILLCKERKNIQRITTNDQIKYIFNTFPEHRDARIYAEGLRVEFNDITHDHHNEIIVGEKDVLRCAKNLKLLISNFSFKKNEITKTEKKEGIVIKNAHPIGITEKPVLLVNKELTPPKEIIGSPKKMVTGSENTVQRLSKVAKELNVSISNITEFLKSKGHIIENNPMAQLPNALYKLLSKEYPREKD